MSWTPNPSFLRSTGFSRTYTWEALKRQCQWIKKKYLKTSISQSLTIKSNIFHKHGSHFYSEKLLARLRRLSQTCHFRFHFSGRNWSDSWDFFGNFIWQLDVYFIIIYIYTYHIIIHLYPPFVPLNMAKSTEIMGFTMAIFMGTHGWSRYPFYICINFMICPCNHRQSLALVFRSPWPHGCPIKDGDRKCRLFWGFASRGWFRKLISWDRTDRTSIGDVYFIVLEDLKPASCREKPWDGMGYSAGAP